MIIQLLSSFLLIFSSLFWGYILANPKSKTRIWVYSFVFPTLIFAYHIFIFWVSFPQANYLNFNQQSYSTGVEMRNCLLPFIISVSALYLLYSKQTATKSKKIIKVFLFTLILIIIGIEANLKKEENVVSQNSIQYREDSIRKASIPKQMTQPKTSGRDLRNAKNVQSMDDIHNEAAIKVFNANTKK